VIPLSPTAPSEDYPHLADVCTAAPRRWRATKHCAGRPYAVGNTNLGPATRSANEHPLGLGETCRAEHLLTRFPGHQVDELAGQVGILGFLQHADRIGVDRA